MDGKKRKGKFKAGLVKEIKAERERERRQERLRSRHHIKDSHVLVVEKANMVKFFIHYSVRLIHLLAAAAVFALATLGLLALIYPEVRMPLFGVIHQVFTDMRHML